MRKRLHPDDRPTIEVVAERMGVTFQSARAMLERLGFAVCESCGRFHKKSEGCKADEMEAEK